MAENPQVHRGGPTPVDYDGFADGQDVPPGALLTRTAAEDGYSPHATAAGTWSGLVALSEPYFGDRKDDVHPLDDAYPAGEHVHAGVAQKGALVGLRLPAATALAENTEVVSDGAGNIRAFDAAGGDAEAAKLGIVVGGSYDSGAGDILATVRLY